MTEARGNTELSPKVKKAVLDEAVVTQSLHWPISPMDHSRLHAKGIEHEHYSTGVMLNVSFLPSRAYGVLPLSLDHKYIFDVEMEYPVFDQSGNIETEDLVYTAGKKLDERTYEREFRPARLKVGKVSIRDLVIQKAREMLDCNICINEVLIDASKRMAGWGEAREQLKVYNETARHEFLQKERENVLFFEKRKDEEEAREQQLLQKRNDWIVTHGSLRLKKCLEEGYDCRKLYYVERGAKLLGEDFCLDYDDVVLTESCRCPSLESLEMIDILRKNGLSGCAVWLPKGLQAVDTKYGSVSCEAVVVVFEDKNYYRIFDSWHDT